MIPVNLENLTRPGGSAAGKVAFVSSSSNPGHGSTRLSVIIVNYRSWPDVLTLVSSLAESPGVNSGTCEILIVDNASPEPSPTSLLDPGPGIRLILRSDNAGFASGVNAGWRASTSPWLLVLNPDVIPDAGFVESVLDRIESYGKRPEGEPGIVGFGLRNPDGSRQPSVGAFPGLFRTIWEQLIPRPRRKYQPDWRVKPGPVDWVTGACLLLNATMLEAVGGMDEEFFLYHEEVALCRSAHRLGWRVEFDPGVSVVHLRPFEYRPISPKMRVITRHSKLLYFQKHLPPWQFAALSAAVKVEARVRGIWSVRRGNREEARSWQAVEKVAKGLEAGTLEGGRAVLNLAETVEDDADDPEPAPRLLTSIQAPSTIHGTSHGTRRLQP
jgi:N-acetylglucosaminyl-diphospho-decaprenol L-rhamnosyltransferase